MSKTQLAATVYLTCEKTGEVLLLLNKKLDLWLPPGGHVEPGEIPSVGALREMKEETGIDLTDEGYHPYHNSAPGVPFGYLGYLEQYIRDTWFLIHTFHYFTTADHVPCPILDERESGGFVWVHPARFDPSFHRTTPNVLHTVRMMPSLGTSYVD